MSKEEETESSSSSSSDDSDEAISESVSQLGSTAFVLPNFGGVSVLSFTPAFSFSFAPVLHQYKARNDALAKQKQPIPPSEKRVLPRLPPKNKTNKKKNNIADMSQRIHRKIVNKNAILKYIKKLEPVKEDTQAKGNQAKSKTASKKQHKKETGQNIKSKESTKSVTQAGVSPTESGREHGVGAVELVQADVQAAVMYSIEINPAHVADSVIIRVHDIS